VRIAAEHIVDQSDVTGTAKGASGGRMIRTVVDETIDVGIRNRHSRGDNDPPLCAMHVHVIEPNPDSALERSVRMPTA
jgi:hypothetical protein